ncbi:MAG: hypothetical protein COA79_25575 [Planctomycetota bacterium]|nr:MAG: hypothetical protein COA79_25575 [Planctomycetota bacterium]
MTKKQFSLIEMMAVIVVILILITLAIPKLNQIRKKSRSIICANQLKQLGALIATYANDNDGYLPYTNNYTYYSSYTISYKDKRSAGPLYGSWAGHLIPYFDVNLKTWDRGNYYHDKAGSGGYTFAEDTGDIYRPGAAIADENFGNWRLLHDMFYEGGYGDFKMMICPEAPMTFNSKFISKDRFVPRISGLIPTNSGRTLYGLPSSYLCNGPLFGRSAWNSQRYEDVSNNNFLLLEGCGQGTQNIQSHATSSWKRTFSTLAFYGGSINVLDARGNTVQNLNSPPPNIAFSFMHNDTQEFWNSRLERLSIANVNKYNHVFKDSAAVKNLDRSEGKHGMLIANRYPGEKWENYETSFSKGKFGIYRYYSEDWMPSYYFGKMNLLIADLSVNKAHLSWVYENARQLGENAQ